MKKIIAVMLLLSCCGCFSLNIRGTNIYNNNGGQVTDVQTAPEGGGQLTIPVGGSTN